MSYVAQGANGADGYQSGSGSVLALTVRKEGNDWKVVARHGAYFSSEYGELPLDRYPNFGKQAISDQAMATEIARRQRFQAQVSRAARIKEGLPADSPTPMDMNTAVSVAAGVVRDGFSSLNPVLVNGNISASPQALPLRQYYFARYLAQTKNGLSPKAGFVLDVRNKVVDCHNYYCVIRLEAKESATSTAAETKFYTIGLQKEELLWKVVSARQDNDTNDSVLAQVNPQLGKRALNATQWGQVVQKLTP